MKNIGRNNRKIWGYILMAVVLIVCIVVMVRSVEKPLPRDKDTEFQNGTDIRLDTVTELQQESLYKLCKVWGYAKYRHPSVIDGTLNWDAELFRVMPEVLAADSSSAANEAMAAWLGQFPFEVPALEGDAKEWVKLAKEESSYTLDSSWIEDGDFLGEALSGYLQRLSQVYISDREYAYAAFDENSPYVSLENEKSMEVGAQDAGAKLLSLFRFWNIYEYYSPYLDITKRDWDEVLKSAIPRMIDTEDYRGYVLEIARVASETGDAHMTVASKGGVVQYYYGTYYLPCSILYIDGQAVVSAAANVTDDGLKPGDVLVEIDGTSVSERIETLRPYVVLPEEDKIVNKISEPLLAVKAATAKVKVVRDGRKKSLTVETLKEKFRPKNPYENGLLEGENIGYIDPGVLKKGEIEELMEAFADAEGMIVDLRSYPSVFIPYLLGEYITPEPKQFADMSFQNRAVPGSFLVQNNLLSGAGVMKKNHMSQKEYPAYHGKVVILMNETSQSQSEFTVMALRQSPNAVVVGSPSIGADGNVVKISLPGRVNMYMSGLGVFTPEGRQTQRVGLTPDVECYPTVEGLRDNRDELIEKAVEIIRGESGE